MITLELAQKLKDAGLKWEPHREDKYTFEPVLVPKGTKNPEMIEIQSDRYVLDNACAVGRYTRFTPANSIWLPSLEQLLEEIEKRGWKNNCMLSSRDKEEYQCTISQKGHDSLKFYGATQEEAAGYALLWILNHA